MIDKKIWIRKEGSYVVAGGFKSTRTLGPVVPRNLRSEIGSWQRWYQSMVKESKNKG